MVYTNEKLTAELQRFYKENGRIPTAHDMTNKNGYPSFMSYISHFKTWNNALETAGYKPNQIHHELDGTEVCCYCGKRADEIFGFIHWLYPNGIRYCHQHGQGSDYVTGTLDKNSNIGKGTISEQVVKNVLNLEERYDCNFACGFGYPIDLYHKEKYKYINVKDSKLHKDNVWHFTLKQKETPDTYVMLGYDEDRKNILRVWITDAIDDFVFNEKTETLLQSKGISNSYGSLKKAKPWEVDAKPYDDMLHMMSEKRKETNGKGCFLRNSDL